MGSEYTEATSTPPKLSLFSSIPVHRPTDPPGMLTPPINSAVSIPFQWEEAPGKPRRPRDTQSHSSAAARCLELPPRLLLESSYCRVSSMPSPTTVLDGPDSGRFSLSSRRGESRRLSRRALFGSGSGNWKSFRKTANVGDVSGVGSGFDSPPSAAADRVKITRVRRHASFLNLSSHQAGTSVLANIYKGLKQVVPWRRGHEKMRERGS